LFILIKFEIIKSATARSLRYIRASDRTVILASSAHS